MSTLDNILKLTAVVCLTTVTAFTGMVGIKVYKTVDGFSQVSESLGEASRIGTSFLDSLQKSITSQDFETFKKFCADLGNFLQDPKLIEKIEKDPEKKDQVSPVILNFVGFLDKLLTSLNSNKEGAELVNKISELVASLNGLLTDFRQNGIRTSIFSLAVPGNKK